MISRRIRMSALVMLTTTVVSGRGESIAGLIGIDAIHGQGSSDYLATGDRFDTLRATITNMGHTIVPIRSFNAANLLGLDALVVLNSYSQDNHPYATGEIAAIQSFVNMNQQAVFVSDSTMFADPDFGDRPITFGNNLQLFQNTVSFITGGRGVFFIGDSGSGSNVSNFNTLTAPFGVTYATAPTDQFGRTISALMPHALTQGVATVGVDYQLPLSISSPALDLTLGGGQDNFIAVLPEPGSLVSMVLIFVTLISSRLCSQRYKRSATALIKV